MRAAAVELLARFPAVLVERLVSDGIAELLVGVRTDPVFGPVLSLGVGGVLTELVRDVAHLVLPVDAAEIRRALLGLRCAPLLTGYRGAPSADLDRLVAVVARVAELVLDMPELVELEINPLIVTADGAWACDALVVTSGGEDERGAHAAAGCGSGGHPRPSARQRDRPGDVAGDGAGLRRLPRRPRAAGRRAAHRRASVSSARDGTSRRPPRATPSTATTAWAASAASRSCRA